MYIYLVWFGSIVCKSGIRHRAATVTPIVVNRKMKVC